MKLAHIAALAVLTLFPALLPTAARAQISEDALRAHVSWLADDARQGRSAGGSTEEAVTDYLVEQFTRDGLQPGWKGQWLQPVKLIARRQRDAVLNIRVDGAGLPLAPTDLLMRGARGGMERLPDVPLLYLGTPDQAMEAAGSRDLRGMAALILLSDPNADQSVAFDKAAAVLAHAGVRAVIATSRAVSWFAMTQRVRNGFWETDDRPLAPVEGMFAPALSDRLIDALGDNLDAQVRVSGYARTQIDRRLSHNVVARLPGSEPASGAVILLAHWDHIGQCRRRGDRICNGAVDNASGVAALIEIGRALHDGAQARRDIYLLSSTAEELGLLGSRAFTRDPPVPITRFVAGFNLDSIAIGPRGAPLAVVGRGETVLDPYVAQVAKAMGRTIGDTPGADIYFQRQDGWSLIQAGIPALMINSGFADDRWLAPYIDARYHQPGDETAAIPDMGGAADDADFHVALARFFADPGKFPGRMP